MAKARDHAAIYARRKARAAARGTTVYRQYAKREAVAPAKQRVFPEPDGRFVRSNREAELRATFRQADAHGGRIPSAIVTVQTPDGPQSITLWGKGGIDGAAAWSEVQSVGALAFLVDQLDKMGASRYLGMVEVEAGDILGVQMAAEW